jgi:hypothetical protein
MVGLIFKIGLFFAIVIAILLFVLNITNVWNPGTISVTAPDVAPCHRWIETYHKGRDPQIVQVRWIMTMKDYGWGCYIEFGDFDVETVSPMPK